MRGAVIDRDTSVLQQQREQVMDLYGAVDASGDIDLGGPTGVIPEGCFKDRHLVRGPVDEEIVGLLIDDVDVDATGQDPRIALLRQVRIKQGDGPVSPTGREDEHAAHGQSVRDAAPG